MEHIKPPDELEQIFSQLNSRANKLYKFVMLYHDYITQQRDYGTGQMINMVEVHTLTLIEETPGVTVTRLALLWNRTKGAVSQTIKKLEQKGYIYRQKEPDNAKEVHFFATPEGVALSNAHKAYDTRDITETMALLMRRHTAAELDTFYSVIDTYTALMEEE